MEATNNKGNKMTYSKKIGSFSIIVIATQNNDVTTLVAYNGAWMNNAKTHYTATVSTESFETKTQNHLNGCLVNVKSLIKAAQEAAYK